MLTVSLTLKDLISGYISEFQDLILKSDQLSHLDWKLLHIIQDFLKPFKSVTLSLKKDYASLNSVLQTIDILNLHFKETYVSLYDSFS